MNLIDLFYSIVYISGVSLCFLSQLLILHLLVRSRLGTTATVCGLEFQGLKTLSAVCTFAFRYRFPASLVMVNDEVLAFPSVLISSQPMSNLCLFVGPGLQHRPRVPCTRTRVLGAKGP